MKIDRRDVEPPAPRERREDDGRREDSGFDALVAALVRPEPPPRPSPTGNARRGDEVRRNPEDDVERDESETVDAQRDDRDGCAGRTDALGDPKGMHEAKDMHDPKGNAHTMPPEIAVFVRFASDPAPDASGFAPGPPPLPWTKGGREWAAPSDGKLPAPPLAPNVTIDGRAPVEGLANTIDLEDVDAIDATAPNEVPAARARFVWRPPLVREPVARPDASVEVAGSSKEGTTSTSTMSGATSSASAAKLDATGATSSATSAAKLDAATSGAISSQTVSNPSASVANAWLGATRLSDEAYVANALAAVEERRGPRALGELDRESRNDAPNVVLDLSPTLVRRVTSVLEAAVPEPSTGEALMRAASRFTHEDSTIRLSHPELGRVRLHLALEAEGLDVRAVAESALAARILAESEDTLRREIGRHGVALRRLKVRVEVGPERSETPSTSPSTARPPRPRR